MNNSDIRPVSPMNAGEMTYDPSVLRKLHAVSTARWTRTSELALWGEWNHSGEGTRSLSSIIESMRSFNWDRFIKPGMVCIDIGGHSGDTAIPMALFSYDADAGRRGHVIVVEPNPAVIAVLDVNLAMNTHVGEFFILNAAVTKKDVEEIELADHGNAECNGGVLSGDLSQAVVQRLAQVAGVKYKTRGISLTTLFEQIARNITSDPVGFIKIDCEGYDKEIIKSCRELFAVTRPTLFIEWFDWFTPEDDVDLFSTIEAIDYIPFEPLGLKQANVSRRVSDLLCVHKESPLAKGEFRCGDNSEYSKALKSKLALAFIIKDEGSYALEMLDSIIPIVGFVSCVDTGSTDNTVEIVENFLKKSGVGFSIMRTQFSRFDVVRNQAISLVPKNFDWIIMLDADEIILDRDFREILGLINSNDVDAWAVPRFNWRDRIFGERPQPYPDHQGRLFRNFGDSRIQYSGIVHEQLIGYANKQLVPGCADGNLEQSGFHIHHIKLFRKSHEDLIKRELLYRELSSTRSKGVRKDCLDKLWYGAEPFENGAVYLNKADPQGWRSDHPYLRTCLEDVRPSIVVEIGVWKGGSTITMARYLKESGIAGVVIAVDTWLGSWDHWQQPQWFSSLRMKDGYPTLYETFVANIVKASLQDHVVPLPLDSTNAAYLLESRGIVPNVVHIDGANDYDSVLNDLRRWWSLLSPGGILIGDDYDPVGGSWPEVKRAFDDFFQTTSIENIDGKCRVKKPQVPS